MSADRSKKSDDLIERLEMFADHGAPTMIEAQELMSDALLEIRRLRRTESASVNGKQDRKA